MEQDHILFSTDERYDLNVSLKSNTQQKTYIIPNDNWVEQFSEAYSFIKELCQNQSQLSLANSQINHEFCYGLTRDLVLVSIYKHYMALREYIPLIELNTPNLNDDLSLSRLSKPAHQVYKLNPYVRAFLTEFYRKDFLTEFYAFDPLRDNCVPEYMARHCISGVNQSLQRLYNVTKQPDFKCGANNIERAADKNRKGLVTFINALFQRYSRLLVLRIDFGYKKYIKAI
ncbi:hypothetical protein [Chromatium okenii]|jgi:hypothetical protein|uniref:hypothetical protein n=1 Tax=Chromatium okenii TaxID=61644 RepID=UPI0026EEA805|nr:hypothetical protein [Chromatium okenii]MBV5311169.1 hypothetical protein [Chromatium okenii]